MSNGNSPIGGSRESERLGSGGTPPSNSPFRDTGKTSDNKVVRWLQAMHRGAKDASYLLYLKKDLPDATKYADPTKRGGDPWHARWVGIALGVIPYTALPYLIGRGVRYLYLEGKREYTARHTDDDHLPVTPGRTGGSDSELTFVKPDTGYGAQVLVGAKPGPDTSTLSQEGSPPFPTARDSTRSSQRSSSQDTDPDDLSSEEDLPSEEERGVSQNRSSRDNEEWHEVTFDPLQEGKPAPPSSSSSTASRLSSTDERLEMVPVEEPPHTDVLNDALKAVASRNSTTTSSSSLSRSSSEQATSRASSSQSPEAQQARQLLAGIKKYDRPDSKAIELKDGQGQSVYYNKRALAKALYKLLPDDSREGLGWHLGQSETSRWLRGTISLVDERVDWLMGAVFPEGTPRTTESLESTIEELLKPNTSPATRQDILMHRSKRLASPGFLISQDSQSIMLGDQRLAIIDPTVGPDQVQRGRAVALEAPDGRIHYLDRESLIRTALSKLTEEQRSILEASREQRSMTLETFNDCLIYHLCNTGGGETRNRLYTNLAALDEARIYDTTNCKPFKTLCEKMIERDLELVWSVQPEATGLREQIGYFFGEISEELKGNSSSSSVSREELEMRTLLGYFPNSRTDFGQGDSGSYEPYAYYRRELGVGKEGGPLDQVVKDYARVINIAGIEKVPLNMQLQATIIHIRSLLMADPVASELAKTPEGRQQLEEMIHLALTVSIQSYDAPELAMVREQYTHRDPMLDVTGDGQPKGVAFRVQEGCIRVEVTQGINIITPEHRQIPLAHQAYVRTAVIGPKRFAQRLPTKLVNPSQ